MMIGPLPMSRIVLRSSLRGTVCSHRSARPHELRELLEEIARVVWTRTRFGVELDAECAEMLAAHAFDIAIVQVQVTDRTALRERGRVDRVVVVLTRDLDPTRRQVLHGVVATVVAEAELERPGAQG